MNTFGQSYVQGSQARLQYPLYDPRSVRDNRTRFRRPYIPNLYRANSFYCPSGRYPCKGWILLARSDYNNLNRYSTNLELNIGDPQGSSDNVQPLKYLSVIQAQCVTRGLTTDPNALYLVDITDRRGLLCNKWFQFPLTAQYNIRAPAYPEVFHPNSLNSGTTWTWLTMLQDIWNTMSSFLGTYPGIPITPSGIPEGFWFTGVNAWDALNDILDHLGLQISCDLTDLTTPYTIVESGAADSSFDAQQLLYKTNLEDDQEWIDIGAGRVPKTVKVLFRRRNAIYGSEETVTYTNDNSSGQQWDMNTVYQISVTAPSQFNSAVGIHYLWSDFTVRYDQDSVPLSADTTTATLIAQERVAQYFNRIYDSTLGSMTQTYAGALPFSTGSRVDGVCWYQDHRYDPRAAWRTQIVRSINPPWPEIYDDY